MSPTYRYVLQAEVVLVLVERRYLFLYYLLDHFGRVDLSRNLAHARRLNFTRAFIHGICSVFIPLNRFHLQIIQPLLALPMDVSASRRHNGNGCRDQPMMQSERLNQLIDLTYQLIFAMHNVINDLNLF